MALGLSGSNGGINMALGISGSNAGVDEAYQRFAVADVEAGVTKYRALIKQIPATQVKLRTAYEKIIGGLEELRKDMASELEVKTQG